MYFILSCLGRKLRNKRYYRTIHIVVTEFDEWLPCSRGLPKCWVPELRRRGKWMGYFYCYKHKLGKSAIVLYIISGVRGRLGLKWGSESVVFILFCFDVVFASLFVLIYGWLPSSAWVIFDLQQFGWWWNNKLFLNTSIILIMACTLWPLGSSSHRRFGSEARLW